MRRARLKGKRGTMSIWEYANPKKFMQTSAWALPWVTGLAVVLAVIYAPIGLFAAVGGHDVIETRAGVGYQLGACAGGPR